MHPRRRRFSRLAISRKRCRAAIGRIRPPHGTEFCWLPSPIRASIRAFCRWPRRRCARSPAMATSCCSPPRQRCSMGMRPRAQVFLKRFRKRYVAIDTCHLLRALALAQENKLVLGAFGAGSPRADEIGSTLCTFFPEALRVGHGSPISTTGFSSATSPSGARRLAARPGARPRARGQAQASHTERSASRRPHRLRCR